jgi:hypothetical protein
VPDDQNDPSANTAAFQAFVREAVSGDPELPGSRSKLGVVIGAAAALIIVVAVVVFLVAR